MKLKPEKKSFILFPVMWTLLILTGLFMLLLIYVYYSRQTFLISLFFGPAFLYLLFVLSYRQVKYSKEEYEFFKDKIIMRTGGFFSNHEIELRIKNITQVTRNLPYFQRKIFNTGNVFVKAAGSGSTEISITHIIENNDIFEKIQDLMIKNGFTLSKKDLIQREKPNSLAVFLEVVRNFVIGLFIAYFAIISAFLDVIDVRTSLLPFITLLIVIAVSLIGINVFRYMDLMRKTYFLYKDTVYYEDKFFTENYSYIPIENLSDSELTQGFITKLLGLYNLRISSKGQSNEILFFYIENGEDFDKNLDVLINETEPLQEKKELKTEKSEYKIEKKQENRFKGKTSMDMSRTVVSTLINYGIAFFIAVIIFVIAYSFIGIATLIAVPFVFGILILSGLVNVVKDVVDVLFTKFVINYRSVESNYSFLTSSNIEFSNDKITLIKVKSDVYDKIFNTVTISFHSIGSSSALEFKNIKRDVKLIKDLLEKIGVKKEPVKVMEKPKFSFMEMLKANIGNSLISLILLLATPFLMIYNNLFGLIPVALLIVYLITVIYRTIYYKKSYMKFYDNHIYFRKGIFIEEEFFTNYDQTRDLYSKRYPFSDTGNLKVIVAGEVVMRGQQGQSIPVKAGFTIRYLKNVLEKHDFKDEILAKKMGVKSNYTKVKSCKPDFANPLALTYMLLIPIIIALTLFRAFFLPVMLIAVIIISIIIIIKTRRKTYSLDGFRAVYEKGILFRMKKTVLYSKMDHLSKDSDFLNKVFNNGNIKVYTTGSSSPELVINNIKKRDDFYNTIEKNYR